MIRQGLVLMGFKYGVYIAVFVFFLACFLGYASNLAIDTFIQKAVIAGCLSGLVFFVLVKMLVKYVPKDTIIVKEKVSDEGNKSG